MKIAFHGSLCYEGIRGGAITVEDDIVRYRSKSLTLPEEYKDIRLPVSEIERAEVGYLFVLPTVTVQMKSGEKYRFVVFARKQFLACLAQLGIK